ncbi:MAG: tryptophan synthase subunit alpha [Actinobacteria bacterium]|nr:tryptophan synthase subunit alpha [Actinomycetota bacterium]
MTPGEERIANAFAKAPGRAALMPYLMGGFPDSATSRRIALAYADAGADLIELGMPFSDPIADGPVIQAAAGRALAAGTGVEDVLEIARAVAARVPVVLMTYANLVLARGMERFAADAAAAGASGLIVPDVPLEEAPALGAACTAAGIALIPLVAPTTTDERLERIGGLARGFLYTVSVTGTTGERAALSDAFGEIVARAKRATDAPVALGFGIATPEQASAAADAGADGVIIGSRLVREAADADDPVAAVEALVRSFAEALR